MPHLLAKRMSVLRLSPTIKNLFKFSFCKLCYFRIKLNPKVSGLPIIFIFCVPEAVCIILARLPPDGRSLSFPSFLSILVPSNCAPFCYMYKLARHIFLVESLKSVPTITATTVGSTYSSLNFEIDISSSFDKYVSSSLFDTLIPKFSISRLKPYSPITKTDGS